MLECPRCGQPEILRKRIGNEQFVMFGCLFSIYLPADKNDDELQRMLDEWERTGGMDEWLRKPLFDPSNRFTLITDPEIVKMATKRFEELWKKGKKIGEAEGEEDE